MAQGPKGVGLYDVGLGVVVDGCSVVVFLLHAVSYLLIELCVALAALLIYLAGIDCLAVVLFFYQIAEHAQHGFTAVGKWCKFFLLQQVKRHGERVTELVAVV